MQGCLQARQRKSTPLMQGGQQKNDKSPGLQWCGTNGICLLLLQGVNKDMNSGQGKSPWNAASTGFLWVCAAKRTPAENKNSELRMNSLSFLHSDFLNCASGYLVLVGGDDTEKRLKRWIYDMKTEAGIWIVLFLSSKFRPLFNWVYATKKMPVRGRSSNLQKVGSKPKRCERVYKRTA